MTTQTVTLPARISLCGSWDFTYTPTFEASDMPQVFEAQMPVPGIWDDHLEGWQNHAFFATAVRNPAYKPVVDFPFPTDQKSPGDASLPYLFGTGWYRHMFTAAALPTDGRFVLNLGPARMELDVWLNRRHVAHYKGHNTPVRLDITDAVVRGEANEIVLAVTNTCTDRFGCDNRGYKGQSGGIIGDSWIDVVGTAYIDDLYVHEATPGQLQWQVSLGGIIGRGCLLRWQVQAPDGEMIDQGSLAVEGHTAAWTSDSTHMTRWSDTNPALYTLILVLESEGQALDRLQQATGLRTIRVEGRGLLLNDTPLYLRGGTEHCYFPETCTTPTEKEYYVKRIAAWQRIGINWFRCHTWTPPAPFLEAADEAGMLLQVEPARGYSLEEWTAIVRTCRTHPSVILYCCGNEEWLTDEKIDYLEACQKLLRTWAPDALFNPQEALRGVEYGWDMPQVTQEEVDACTDVPFLHHPARLARLRAFSDVFGNYPHGKFSYSSCYGDLTLLNDQMTVYERPLLAHEIGILGTYIDLSLEHRYLGTRIGTELYAKVREHLTEAGVLELAPVYYRNSCRQMYALVKDLLESARLCSCLAGYNWLAPSDHHWHRSGYHCGVLNEFQEVKWEDGIGDIITVNSQSVLLLDHRRAFNVVSGQHVSLPLIVSLFSPTPIEHGDVAWQLLDSNGETLANGQWATDPIATGANTTLGRIEWVIDTDAPKTLTLEVHLQSESVDLSNRWTFWLFPDVPITPLPPQVQVTDELGQASVTALANGARIVLLGPGPFPAVETRFQPGIAGRQFGHAATVVQSHPALGDFPHDGFCDWQFKPLRDGSHNVVFNDLDTPFAPIIDVPSSYKHVFKAAILFELKIGEGALLVCSMNLSVDDPAASYLKSQLIRYAASDQFAPATGLSPEALRAIIGERHTTIEQAESDMALDPNAEKQP